MGNQTIKNYANNLYFFFRKFLEKLKNLPLKAIKHHSQFPFSNDLLKDYIIKNRKSLDLVENWINENSITNSWYNYGIPDYIRSDINKKINSEITYSDLLLFLSDYYFEKLNYLEIGVSVGKNFLQIINGINPSSKIFGFDIEDINPVLEKYLQFKSKKTWDTPVESLKKSESSLTYYKYSGKDIAYLCGDVWDSYSWEKLSDNKFNLIFSDALHTPEAIQFEFEQIVKNKLLDEKFIIIWDDLEGEMENAFCKIIKKYKMHFNIKEIYLIKINGWIGEHERKHHIGLISNFTL